VSVTFDGDWIIPILALKQTLAGGFGGLSRWLLTGGTGRDLLAAVVVGMACGHYLVPLVGTVTGLTTNSELADAFILGIVGVLVVKGLLVIVQRNFGTDDKPKDDEA